MSQQYTPSPAIIFNFQFVKFLAEYRGGKLDIVHHI